MYFQKGIFVCRLKNFSVMVSNFPPGRTPLADSAVLMKLTLVLEVESLVPMLGVDALLQQCAPL